jgi:hypothetical protein
MAIENENEHDHFSHTTHNTQRTHTLHSIFSGNFLVLTIMAYHQKNDSGICLEGNLDPKQSQPAKDCGPNPSITSGPPPLYPRIHRSIHYSQLTESERSRWLPGSFNIPIPPHESSKAKTLSGYPIPYFYNIAPKRDSHMKQPPREQLQPVNKEPLISEPSKLKRRRNPRQEKAERFFDMFGGRTPGGFEKFLREHPSEYEHELIEYLRWHAAEVMEELTMLSRHHGPLHPDPCDRARPSGPKKGKEELPERWFSSIEEAWAHRPRPAQDDSLE